MWKPSVLLYVSCLVVICLLACTNSQKNTAQNECAEGNGEGCRKLGQILEEDGNLKGARDNYDLSCKLANTNGCIRLAELQLKAGEKPAAMQNLKYACDRGNTNACSRYAELLSKSMQ